MTPFRTSQARVVLIGALRVLAPHMVSSTLRQLVFALWRDEYLWRDLAEPHPPSETPKALP